jgi:hypothetical protein
MHCIKVMKRMMMIIIIIITNMHTFILSVI